MKNTLAYLSFILTTPDPLKPTQIKTELFGLEAI